MYQILLYLILHEAQHVSGDTQNFDTLLHLGGFFTVRLVLWCTDPRTSDHRVWTSNFP